MSFTRMLEYSWLHASLDVKRVHLRTSSGLGGLNIPVRRHISFSSMDRTNIGMVSLIYGIRSLFARKLGRCKMADAFGARKIYHSDVSALTDSLCDNALSLFWQLSIVLLNIFISMMFRMPLFSLGLYCLCHLLSINLFCQVPMKFFACL